MTVPAFQPKRELVEGLCAACGAPSRGTGYWCSNWCRYRWQRWDEQQRTRVVNIKTEVCDVRIDRTSPWGNPFVVGRDGNRDKVISLYEAWIMQQPELLAKLSELAGKRLGCWCRPLRCHGDVLVRLIEELEA